MAAGTGSVLMIGRQAALVVMAVAMAAAPAVARAAGLPQLDPSTFAPQVIWLAISFVLLYLIVSRVALPRISQVMDEREKRIEDALAKAKALKMEADQVAAAYDKALADARVEAQELLRQTGERLAREAASRHGELGARVADEIKAGEARINTARDAAIANIRGLAMDVAQAAVARLSGEATDARQVAPAVDSALEERA